MSNRREFITLLGGAGRRGQWRCRAAGPPLDVSERAQRRHLPRGVWLRTDARGGDGGVREKLAEELICASDLRCASRTRRCSRQGYRSRRQAGGEILADP